MKLTLAEPKYLKESVAIISEIVTEATLKITSEAVALVAMDPANVALVIFKLLSSSFVTYDIEGPTNITVNLNNLKQVLRRVKSNDTLTLELEENKLKVTLQSTSKRTFHLPLIELDDKEQRVPDLSFVATIVMQSSTLIDAVDDVDVVGESVTFSATQDKFSISSKGDLTKAAVDIPADKTTKIVCEDEGVKAKYSIEYLKKMMQGAKIADVVQIKFSRDYPLRLEYVVQNKLELSFVLAPRVDND
ncbi:proliferating cell nuclear antigen (pcna) [Candidatus Woesearchaeota archaeon]|nr:proliferating cell nuclear antigen (pcna) [Candidatus Woesearchaeota archaeon]